MISFRYHLVSIVAVFVALAVGILVGGTLLNSGFESGLKSQVTGLSNSLAAQRTEIRALQTELSASSAAGKQMALLLMQERLTGEPVVLVADAGVDASEVAAVRQALSQAGATLQGVVVLEPTLSDPGSQAQLAQAVGLPPSTSEGTLATTTAKALGRRLLEGAPISGDDPLATLGDAGFVRVNDAAKGGLKAVGGPGQSVIFLAGAPVPAVDTQRFVQPFLQTLVEDGRPVAAGEPTAATGDQSYLTAIRGDGTLDGTMVTVDNIDQLPGQVAMVLGLEDLIQTGAGGDYGDKCGSCTLLPRP